MKKPALTLTLLLGLTLSNVMPLQAMQSTEQPRQPSLRLLSIIKKKYIAKQPLEKNEQQYLKNASIIAIAAAFVLLLSGGGAFGIKKIIESDRKNLLDQMNMFGVKIEPGKDIDELASFFGTLSFNDNVLFTLKRFPKYRRIYYKLSKQGGFKRALSSVTGKKVDDLPTLKKHKEGAYYFGN